MNMKSIVRFLVAFCSILVLLIVLNPLFPGFIALIFEKSMAKKALNNSYVNQDFQGWKEVRIDGFDAIYIPQGWNVEFNDGYYIIFDNRDSIIGYSVLFDANNERFSSWQVFFDEIIGSHAIEITRTHPAGITTGGRTYYCEITLAGEKETILYCLNLENYEHDTDFLLAFTSDNGLEYGTMKEILAAISFSFEYPES